MGKATSRHLFRYGGLSSYNDSCKGLMSVTVVVCAFERLEVSPWGERGGDACRLA